MEPVIVRILPTFLLATLGIAGSTGNALAAEILVTNNIAVSTTWTSNNTYNLQNQIYVLGGATLTIQPGTVIASTVTPNQSGSLAVARGGQIIAAGTKDAPIIFTSKADVATWDIDASHPTGRNPKTGVWRESCLEWGNLTIMGEGFISENATVGNTPSCSPTNVAAMEGLIAGFPGDPKVLYGGGDDNDDSGTLAYCSFRYGGRVIGLNDELNGLSLGGIGRETDIHHVEIMNNVDDGVEIWGGTVNLKYISIWNIGDDSLDVDQGWRGKVQFGLIVQGYSCDADQGSGVGDNAIETDGAEDSNWQPVTTSTMYNLTVIGQPLDGDGLTTWRDNARVQYRNCIFMDGGEAVVKFDNLDGDGANGYGFNGTLSWPATWTTDYNAVPPHANDCPPGTYTVQTSGKLAEIKDSVFYRNVNAAAYTVANTVGVFNAGNNNVLVTSTDPADAPIKSITRGPLVNKGNNKNMLPVIDLDPQPANEALTAVAFAPGDDGFFDSVKFRGAFAPGWNWLGTWTASYAYDYTTARADTVWCDLGCGLDGLNGDPLLSATGTLVSGSPGTLDLVNARPNTSVFLFVGLVNGAAPFKQGVLKPVPWLLLISNLPTGPLGELHLPFLWPVGLPSGIEFFFQYAIADAAAPAGVALSNAISGTTP
jgi:hypothetical protein